MFLKNLFEKRLLKGVAFFLHMWYYIKVFYPVPKLVCIFLYNKSRRIFFFCHFRKVFYGYF